jgi:hypothetical protein
MGAVVKMSSPHIPMVPRGTPGNGPTDLGMGTSTQQTDDVPGKISQEAAGYEPESPDNMCGECMYFIAPSGCQNVLPPIAEQGTCKLWDDGSAQQGAEPDQDDMTPQVEMPESY